MDHWSQSWISLTLLKRRLFPSDCVSFVFPFLNEHLNSPVDRVSSMFIVVWACRWSWRLSRSEWSSVGRARPPRCHTRAHRCKCGNPWENSRQMPARTTSSSTTSRSWASIGLLLSSLLPPLPPHTCPSPTFSTLHVTSQLVKGPSPNKHTSSHPIFIVVPNPLVACPPLANWPSLLAIGSHYKLRKY